MNLVEYELHTTNAMPTLGEGKLYRYILASNGVFVYAKNKVFEACIPVGNCGGIKGLKPLEPFFNIEKKIPAELLQSFIAYARDYAPLENLGYFRYMEYLKRWLLISPPCDRAPASVRSLIDFGYMPVEIHSHTVCLPYFSDTDDKDENGLRIYCIVSTSLRPRINVRISIYGHWSSIPYESVFEKTEVGDVVDFGRRTNG